MVVERPLTTDPAYFFWARDGLGRVFLSKRFSMSLFKLEPNFGMFLGFRYLKLDGYLNPVLLPPRIPADCYEWG